MYHGATLSEDEHFQFHIQAHIPVQIYDLHQHDDIGYIERFCSSYVKVNNTYYHREQFTFISRPGY